MQELPSRLSVDSLALTSIHSVCAALRDPRADAARLDPARIATAYRSERVFRLDGIRPEIWSEFSGFWRMRDGWIRTHANYPHHASALSDALRIGDAAELEAALSSLPRAEGVARITAAGGLAVEVRAENPLTDARLRRHPLVEIARIGDAPSRSIERGALPLSGIRVLDLTRVIAGPICTRTLALLGADVLRIDPPALPEPEWQHLDTGHGKRSAVLDVASPGFADLLALADVIVLGYRPAGLAALGLAPERIASEHPGIVVAQLSAWGIDQPDRRGFDSLVQAESGIAMIESVDGDRPGALPAQALDHSAGYQLAAGIITALRHRSGGGSWSVRTSLRRVAAELLGMPRRAQPAPERPSAPAAHTQEFVVGEHVVTTAASTIPGFDYSAPRPWGGDEPRW